MLALVVSVDPVDVELAADALWSLGVVAVEERDGEGDQVELWTALGDDQHSLDAIIAGAAASSPVAWQWRFVEVDESVADSWRLHARPTRVCDDLVIVPAWLPSTALGAPTDRDAAHDIVISIEPGATFGAGDHPTTVLSLRALRSLLAAAPGSKVLDVGCGSGVLAVAAVRLGAASAVGIDISPAAVPITMLNAHANGVADAVTVSTTPLADVTPTFDVVVANILAPALIELSDDLVRVVAADGVLVISGVLADRFDHVVRALAPMRTVEVAELDGWAAVTLRH